ncbi:hypothetical protein B0H17DRAFT_1128914 [Mycena rosella]|uniref:Uncharacterized protein n=1 Tax=Mycena rosella TaxID=1033263 RepID=A0AAD7DVW5_MYCRO|nr:hypothetical protein B0H17DRAFT_1128914 [Mycena rosella]
MLLPIPCFAVGSGVLQIVNSQSEQYLELNKDLGVTNCGWGAKKFRVKQWHATHCEWHLESNKELGVTNWCSTGSSSILPLLCTNPLAFDQAPNKGNKAVWCMEYTGIPYQMKVQCPPREFSQLH